MDGLSIFRVYWEVLDDIASFKIHFNPMLLQMFLQLSLMPLTYVPCFEQKLMSLTKSCTKLPPPVFISDINSLVHPLVVLHYGMIRIKCQPWNCGSHLLFNFFLILSISCLIPVSSFHLPNHHTCQRHKWKPQEHWQKTWDWNVFQRRQYHQESPGTPKDRVTILQKSGVIYIFKYGWMDCEDTYIGESEEHL